jgi:hypothetical protein
MTVNPFHVAMGFLGLLGLFLAYSAGWTVREWKCESAERNRLVAEEKAEDKAQAQAHAASTDYEVQRNEWQVQSRDREDRIRVVYRDAPPAASCAAPAAVGGMLDEAVAAANAKASGKSEGGLPAPADGTEGTDRP